MRYTVVRKFKAIALMLLATTLLAACASTQEKALKISLRCDNLSQPFSSFVFCTELTLMQFMNDPQIRSYVLHGKELSERVKRGELSDTAARIDWQKKYPF